MKQLKEKTSIFQSKSGINQYTIGERLGVGGLATVRKATSK